MNSKASVQNTQAAAKFSLIHMILMLLLALVTIGAFANGIRGTFILDDTREIVLNPDIRELSNVGRLIATSRRPVVEVSLALNYALAAKDQQGIPDPAGFHIINILIHTCAALTLFGVIRRTLILPAVPQILSGSAVWIAFGGSALWAIHPLQTESVTYIVQRAESLMGLFVLLTIYAFVRAVQSTSRGRLWLVTSVACCALAMGSKAVAVGIPVVVLTYDWIFVAGSPLAAVRRRPFFYLCLAATWSVFWLTGEAQGILGVRETQGPATVGFQYDAITWWQYALSQPGVILHYLRLSIWPTGQCLDYNWPVANSAMEIVLPLAVIAALGFASLYGIVRRKAWGFLGAWFFVILAPTSSVIPIKDLAFEHRMYLPLAAVTTLAAAACIALVVRFGRHKALDQGAQRLIQAGVLGAMIIALVVLTASRNEAYADEGRMWRDITAKRPENIRAWSNYGFYLHSKGQFREAEAAFRRGLELPVDESSANFREAAQINLGNTLRRLGRPAEAVELYQAVLETRPEAWNALFMLSVTKKDLGDFDGLAQSGEQLITQLSTMNLERNTQAREALFVTYVNLATAMVMKGQFAEALPYYDRAFELKPQASVLSEKGATLIRMQRYVDAEQVLRKAVELEGRYVPALYNLALVCARMGRPEEASLYFQRVLDIDPANAAARQGLRNVGASPVQAQ